MRTYCDYCYSEEHQIQNCPMLEESTRRSIKVDLDSVDNEELEAAAGIYDLTVKEQSVIHDSIEVVLTEDEKVRRLPNQ